ncbi:unnamed protein product, partial [Ectocarpus sp. 8 AP-2014]
GPRELLLRATRGGRGLRGREEEQHPAEGHPALHRTPGSPLPEISGLFDRCQAEARRDQGGWRSEIQEAGA